MKTSSENLIEKTYRGELELSAILLFGNQDGMISGLIKIFYKYFKKKKNIDEIKYFDCKNDKNIPINNIINNSSLFSTLNFIVITNPSEKIYDELEKIELNNNIIIIDGGRIKSNSKLKKYFDSHKNFLSVSCYELNRNTKTKIINMFLDDNNITLEKTSYWYLVENISNEFLILEKELSKISAFKDSSVSIENLKLLLIQDISSNLDDLFFECASKNRSVLLKKTNAYIRSTSDSYEIVRNIKKFVQILALASTNKETASIDSLTNIYLPKYLFKKKEVFKKILDKISSNKITKIAQLIQKTEILLRKNSSHYLEITQRFLLNFSKIIK